MRTLLLALLLATPLAAADLGGRVLDRDGKPIRDAHVYVYNALPKKGVSVVCPSCYRDCGKEVAVNANGEFRVQSVDPSLKFRLLAVADGYEPALSENHQDAATPFAFALQPRAAGDEARLVRGRVVDPKGKPVVGAMAMLHAVHEGKRTGWGKIPGVDPLSITNAKGEFVLRVPDPDMLLDVRIHARNYGVKLARELYPNVPPQTITVDTGAAIAGRLQHDGKPLPGVRMVFVQTDRRSSDFLGIEEIGTDAQGQFVITGLGTGVEYRVFPKMESLTPLAAAAAEVTTGGDGSKSDAGTLAATTGFRVSGRVAGRLPPDTRVTLFSANDAQSVLVKRDGTFVFAGVPATRAQVVVSAAGRKAKPVQLDVKQDVGGVELVLE
ncbi:MAG TPA: hypothetical protein VND45_02165 [Thermoanaerobaculia bacterium]|jgi:hypothetical protein|nr:hypothetical protein [Thermoanaerobaculia bacterium]